MRHASTLDQSFYKPDGTRTTLQERQAERRRADEARKQDAINNPKPEPQPVTLRTLDQLKADVHAEQLGREAARKAQAERESNAPVNPYRAYAKELRDSRRLAPRPEQSRLERRALLHEQYANEWDRKQEQEQAERERRELIEKDPQVKNAREHCESFLKTVPNEEREAAHEAAGIIAEGESALYWSKVREIESRIWNREDAKLKEMKLSTTEHLGDYNEQLSKATAARERLEQAEKATNDKPE